MLDKNLGDAVQTASGDAAASIESAAGVYNEARMAAQLEIGKELSGLGADMAAAQSQIHSDDEKMQQVNAANGEALNSILTKSVPGLQDQTLNAQAELSNGVSDIEKEEVASRVGFASKFAKAMTKGKKKLEKALNQETQRQEGEVKDWIAHTS